MLISGVRDDKRIEGKQSELSLNEGMNSRLQENLKQKGCDKVPSLF